MLQPYSMTVCVCLGCGKPVDGAKQSNEIVFARRSANHKAHPEATLHSIAVEHQFTKGYNADQKKSVFGV